jgi:hypothetical protein
MGGKGAVGISGCAASELDDLSHVLLGWEMERKS